MELKIHVRSLRATVGDGCVDVGFILEPYVLKLRSAFGTSHSSTTSRTNALVSIQIGPTVGYGEAGLPPKKKYCYKADYFDVHRFFLAFQEKFETLLAAAASADYDPFASLPSEFFASCLDAANDEAAELKVLRLLFRALDECPLNTEEYSTASTTAIEAALLDLWGKLTLKPLHRLIGVDPVSKPSFYTAALNEDIDAILDATRFGRGYTHYLKIKLDDNLQRGIEILNALRQEFYGPDDPPKLWSIDANSAWTPEISLKYADLLGTEGWAQRVYMLEQPFPASMLKPDGPNSAELDAWREVKTRYEKLGILVYADESVCDFRDVENLLPYVHGINIKLEKAGGIRGALRTIDAGRKCGLKIWFGQMVSSALNAATAAHLLPLVTYAGDLDGALLMTDASQRFAGGFEWTRSDDQVGLVRLGSAPGIGVVRKPSPRMAKDIADVAEIVSLRQLNGVPIAELERRARPLRAASAGDDYRWDPEEIPRVPEEQEYVEVLRSVRSLGGWLGPQESLKEVLLRDWVAVAQLGATHVELAAHLRRLLSLCPDRAAHGVQYDAASVPDSTLAGSGPQMFDIRRLVTRSYQHSLFSNLDQSDEDAWCDEYLVRHRGLGFEFRVAGNADHGLISLIERFGFYEGGSPDNDLRLHPHTIVAALTGRWNGPALAIEIDRTERHVESLKQQHAKLRGGLDFHLATISSLTEQLSRLSVAVPPPAAKPADSDPDAKHAAYLSGEVDDPAESLRVELEQEQGEVLFAKSLLRDVAAEIERAARQLSSLLAQKQ